MEEKLDQLHKNETWTLVPKNKIKPGHRPLEGKWVYKLKRDVDRNIAWFKAKWVVKGYSQQYRVDFDQTFVVIIKLIAFRIFFAVVAFYNLDIDQINVKIALLYSFIDQLVYVEILKRIETDANQDMVCKLLKILYGLKQSQCL